jgi:hypothetical protein
MAVAGNDNEFVEGDPTGWDEKPEEEALSVFK